MIKLGVTSCFLHPDPTRIVHGHKTLNYLERDMARYLSRPGVMPILLPDLAPAELAQYLDEMDGFVFQGGADLCPRTYGVEPIENGRWMGDEHRDRYELKIMDYAFKHHKPVYAICRGFQVVNAYFGGTLWQDLKIQTGTPVEHRSAEKYDTLHHSVVCPEGSLLAKLYGASTLEVNTVHHQGIQRLGVGLVVDAVCPTDSLIEAFHFRDMDDHFVLAVQWHPEFSATLGDTIISPEPLLDYFLERITK